MANSLTDGGASYTAPVGLIYVFNLIVGTGTLAMPKAFAAAGWLVSAVMVTALAFISYMTSTFVIEAMSTANAIQKTTKDSIQDQTGDDPKVIHPAVSGPAHRHGPSYGGDDGHTGYTGHTGQQHTGYTEDEDESSPLIRDSSSSDSSDVIKYGAFAITERIEMGQMASMFFNKAGSTLFYITLIVYLYGDLAIYAAAVPKSLRDVACTYHNSSEINSSVTVNVTDSDPCWPGVSHINRGDAYRVFLACFTVLLGPFVFFNVQKTKYLQMLTTVLRWLAFLLMLILTIIYLADGHGMGHPKVADMAGIPSLFGTCVYSFMCHHSLPSLVTPIRRKSSIFTLFAFDYSFILIFYSLLAFTGIFTFPNECISDLYTLNFQPAGVKCDVAGMSPVTTKKFIQYYLALFPVFVLSTNFPIIAITLRNNLKTLFYRPGRSYRWSVDHLVFPLLALVPPLVLAFITNNIQFLVNITGSFAGSGVQYIVPASLVLLSRRALTQGLDNLPDSNRHRSPFKHVAWVIFTFVWATVCIVFVGVNNINNWIHGKFS